MRKYFLFILLVTLTSASYSYDLNNHKKINLCAIKLLSSIYGADFLTEKEIQLLIDGNLNEDKPNLGKLWNQHFYNPIKPKELWQRCHSIDKKFDKLVQKYISTKGEQEITLAGAIIHHIQDATCPSHVVPIFHWAGKPDKFDYLEIDSLLPASFNNFAIDDYTNDYPNVLHLKIAKQSLDNIEQRFTIKKIKDGILTTDTIDWSLFWADNPNGWFGDYGLLGKPKKQSGKITDNFLKEEIIVNGCTYQISKSSYEELIREQLLLAVTSTAKFIYYCKMRMNRK